MVNEVQIMRTTFFKEAKAEFPELFKAFYDKRDESAQSLARKIIGAKVCCITTESIGVEMSKFVEKWMRKNRKDILSRSKPPRSVDVRLIRLLSRWFAENLMDAAKRKVNQGVKLGNLGQDMMVMLKPCPENEKEKCLCRFIDLTKNQREQWAKNVLEHLENMAKGKAKKMELLFGHPDAMELRAKEMGFSNAEHVARFQTGKCSN